MVCSIASRGALCVSIAAFTGVAALSSPAGARQTPTSAAERQDVGSAEARSDDAAGPRDQYDRKPSDKHDKGPRVLGVAVVGNEALSDRQILGGLATRSPTGIFAPHYSHYDPLVVQLDRRRIEFDYRAHGFFSAAVTGVNVFHRDGGVLVVFVVHEGPPTAVTDVRVTGVPRRFQHDRAFQRILSQLDIGGRYDHAAFKQVASDLTRFLVDRGYAYARVESLTEVDRDKLTAVISYEADTGPLVHFGATHIEGLTRISEKSVRARIAWKRGQVYSPKKIRQTRLQLSAFGYFDRVDIDIPRTGRPPVADVTIQLHASKHRILRLGGGFAADEARFEVRGLVGYTLRGYVDPLLSVDLDLRPALMALRSVSNLQFGGVGRVTVRRDDFLHPLVNAIADAGYLRLEYEAYSEQGLQTDLALHTALFHHRLLARAGWRFNLLSFFDLFSGLTAADELRLGIVSPYRLGFFFEGLTYDGRNDSINPTLGFYLHAQLEEAGSYAASQFDYVRLLSEARGYVPLGDAIVLAARVQYGRAVSGSLPITQRFFAGGANSQRGFGYRRLAPFVVAANGDQEPVGGNELLLGSVEARFHIMKIHGYWLGGVLFTDTGDVTDGPDQIRLDNLNWAVGGGLFYNTPVGPLGVQVGYRLNRFGPGNPEPNNRVAFHINFGQVF